MEKKNSHWAKKLEQKHQTRTNGFALVSNDIRSAIGYDFQKPIIFYSILNTSPKSSDRTKNM